ncbi:MAG: sensor histidine kinase [Acidobacteriota bacterium]|nr:sensor histidine kinase [Acidobacteriota bacterium]
MASHVLFSLSVVAVLVVVMSVGLAYWQVYRQVDEAASSKVTDVAFTIAGTDDVRDGLAADDPAAALREFAERERALTGTDFVVIMSVDGIRYTHPNPDLVGGRFGGTIAAAQAGGVVVEQYAGSLGPSTRAVVPVVEDGQVIGLVSVGLVRDRVWDQLRELLPRVLLVGLAAGAVSGVAALVVARRVRRQTLGLNAKDLARLHDHHQAVLHAIQEGLVITDQEGRVQVLNDEAARLLGLAENVEGRRIADLGLPSDLAALLTGTGQQADEPHAHRGRVLLVSSSAVLRGGRPVGTLTTLRDRTELAELTGQLGTVRGMADALHAQSHEAANRLHSVVTLIELGRTQEALRFATDELRATQRQRDGVLAAVEEPAVAALLLGKASQAAERGVTLEIDADAHLPAGVLPARESVTILGNLIDNAIEALVQAPNLPERTIVVDAQVDGAQVLLTVSDTGPGLTEDAAEHAFERGWSTKAVNGPAGRGIGLALVQQTVEQLGGHIVVSGPPGATFVVTLPVHESARAEEHRG